MIMKKGGLKPFWLNRDKPGEEQAKFSLFWNPKADVWTLGNFQSMSGIKAEAKSFCPAGPDVWPETINVECIENPEPKPTKPGPTKPGPTKPGPTKPGPTKPDIKCCKRYSVEGDKWQGHYVYRGIFNDAPIYLNPDQMFGVVRMLYLCDECKKWTFGLTKDPKDADSFISESVQECPAESTWEGLKVMGF